MCDKLRDHTHDWYDSERRARVRQNESVKSESAKIKNRVMSVHECMKTGHKYRLTFDSGGLANPKPTRDR
jgi:hypothetical protein